MVSLHSDMHENEPCNMLEHPKTQEPYKGKELEMKTMGNQQETLAAWVAAHLDSDGWIGFNVRMRHKSGPGSRIRPHLLPWVSYSNNNRELAEAVARAINSLGVGCLIDNGSHKTKTGNSHYLVTVAGAKRVHKLLPQLTDWLVAKKQRAINTIKFIESRLSKPTNVTYTIEEIDWALSTRNGSSETLRKALLKRISELNALGDEDKVHSTARSVGTVH